MKRATSFIMIAYVIAIMPVVSYGQWATEFVDTVGDVGFACAIAVDEAGNPHISYRDGTIGWRLKYAHWDGSEWQIAFVETTESVYGVTSIALDGSGNPHIAFYKGIWTGGQLWHAWWDGSNWQQEGVDSLPYNGDVGEWNSIAFDTDGYPHIAYTYSTYGGVCYLKYAYKDASGWHTQIVDSLVNDVDEYKYVSLALDGNNNPHISYYDCSTCDLKYARFESGTVDTQWSRVYGGSSGDWLYGIETMDDGGYITCGFTYSFGAGNQDLWMLKIDENGDTLWSYTYGGWGNDRTYDDLEKTDDGGYIINGTTHSFSPDGTHAMWLVKLDPTGQIEWDRSFSTGQPYDYGESGEAIQTFDGGYIIAGSSFSWGHATSVGFVVKTDSIGNEMWRKTFGLPDSHTQLFDVIQTQDSGYLFVGQTNAYGAGNNDMLILKTDHLGDSVWAKTYGGTEQDGAREILPTEDGNYLVIGYTHSFAQYSSAIWLLKINPDGDTLWSRIYDYWYSAGVNDMENTSDSNYIIVGSCIPDSSDSAHVLLVKITPNGDTLWTKYSGGDSFQVWGSSVVQTTDDAYITVGGKRNYGSTDADGYLLKFNYTPSFWHIERVDTAGSVGGFSSIALDSFDYPHIAYMDYTNYAVKYARWDGSAWQIETVESDIGYGFYTSLALDANDRPHISSGEYAGRLRFAWWDGSDWQIEVVDSTVCCGWTSLAIDDNGYCHIAYYDDEFGISDLKYAKRIPTTSVEEREATSQPIPGIPQLAQNYPNPFNSATSIQYILPRDGFIRLAIYNISGQLVKTLVHGKQLAGKYTITWNGKDKQDRSVSSGVYFYCLEIGDFKSTRKMLLLR